MKKGLIVAAIAGTALTSNAQFTKWDKFTSSLGYSSTTKENEESNSFTLAPSVGYFVTNNLSLGLDLELDLIQQN